MSRVIESRKEVSIRTWSPCLEVSLPSIPLEEDKEDDVGTVGGS